MMQDKINNALTASALIVSIVLGFFVYNSTTQTNELLETNTALMEVLSNNVEISNELLNSTKTISEKQFEFDNFEPYFNLQKPSTMKIDVEKPDHITIPFSFFNATLHTSSNHDMLISDVSMKYSPDKLDKQNIDCLFPEGIRFGDLYAFVTGEGNQIIPANKHNHELFVIAFPKYILNNEIIGLDKWGENPASETFMEKKYDDLDFQILLQDIVTGDIFSVNGTANVEFKLHNSAKICFED